MAKSGKTEYTDAFGHEQLLKQLVNDINYNFVLSALLLCEERKARVEKNLASDIKYLKRVGLMAKPILGAIYVAEKQGETRKYTTLGQCLAEAERIENLILIKTDYYLAHHKPVKKAVK